MRVLRAADADLRVEAVGVLRRVLFPRFGAEPFEGSGPLRALHLLELEAGATLPAFRLANLSVLRLLLGSDGRSWLWRQDCGAGAELPAWRAPVAVHGVELWVQSRRSNGISRAHAVELAALDAGPIAAPGEVGWDCGVWVEVLTVSGSSIPGPTSERLWWQQLQGSAAGPALALMPGDGTPDATSLALSHGAAALSLRAG